MRHPLSYKTSMRSIRTFITPVTAKRWRRFRRHRRAFWSLVGLLVLYLVSLGAELICNDRPLFVRFEGKSYFPAVAFTPDDVFTGSGKQTRPDYRALRDSPLFAERSDNFMVMTPVPYGPYESLDPEELREEVRVTMAIVPQPAVGRLNIDTNDTISRPRGMGRFFDAAEADLVGQGLHAEWPIPEALRSAINQRFRNEDAPAFRATLVSRGGRTAEIALSAFRKRVTPVSTVRLTFREDATALPAPTTVTFEKGPTVVKGAPQWKALPAELRANLWDRAIATFAGGASDPLLTPLDGAATRFSFERNDIQWPHPPTREHPFGIDSAGRDVFARILYGLRISMSFGLLLVVLSMLLGITVGSIQGYYGGALDITSQRFIEIWSAMPFLYVMILVGSIFGPSFGLLLFCYGIFHWIGISYYMRAEFLRLRKFQFVDAARCMGVPPRKIIFRHILPNALTPVITFFPFSLVGAIGSLAALDYLGFGLPPPTPSWGELLHQAQQVRWAWWLIVFPSIALFVVMLLGVLIGEGVREAYDPKPHSKME